MQWRVKGAALRCVKTADTATEFPSRGYTTPDRTFLHTLLSIATRREGNCGRYCYDRWHVIQGAYFNAVKTEINDSSCVVLAVGAKWGLRVTHAVIWYGKSV